MKHEAFNEVLACIQTGLFITVKNETQSTLSNTRNFAREYLSGMTPERLGAELNADKNRLRLLYDEAVGEQGKNLPAPAKVIALIGSLTRRLNPTRRLAFGLSVLTTLVHPFSILPTFMTPLAFGVVFVLLMLELLEKSDVKQEIDLAKQIQLSLLPESEYKTSGLESYSFANTAQVVGGDYIDFVEVEDGLYVVIADVAGKGLSASLYMVRLQALVKMIIEKQHPSPKQLFLELNEYIKSNKNDKTFVTAAAAFFPKNENYFLYARAGHNHPLLFESTSDQVRELSAKGFALGMTTTRRLMSFLHEERIDFNPGDSVLFYTDGLNEARNVKGDEYGMDNLKTLFEVYGKLDAQSMVRKVQSSLGMFIGNAPLLDDITFTCIKRINQPSLSAGAVEGLEEASGKDT